VNTNLSFSTFPVYVMCVLGRYEHMPVADLEGVGTISGLDWDSQSNYQAKSHSLILCPIQVLATEIT